MTYIAPPGYEICADGKCNTPGRQFDQNTGAFGKWHCFPSDGCKGEGCGCYLTVLAPQGKQLRIAAEPPGDKDPDPNLDHLPPGWTILCQCLKKKQGEKQDKGWDVREDLEWIAPKGYKLKKDCSKECFRPKLEKIGEKSYWVCKNGTDCFLVGVAPGQEKRLHILGDTTQRGRVEVVIPSDIPAGWGLACVCLEKE